MFVLVVFPMTVIGAIIGRNTTSDFQAPCRTTRVPRQVRFFVFFHLFFHTCCVHTRLEQSFGHSPFSGVGGVASNRSAHVRWLLFLSLYLFLPVTVFGRLLPRVGDRVCILLIAAVAFDASIASKTFCERSWRLVVSHSSARRVIFPACAGAFWSR